MPGYQFSGHGFFLLTAIIIFFGAGTTYEQTGSGLPRYTMYQDVHVMIFIGFGFLMCFLHKNGFTATSQAYMVAAIGVLWAIIQRGFWNQAFNLDPTQPSQWSPIPISLYNLIGADFCVGAVLISMGAVVGRVTADQLLLMAVIEIIFYSVNEAILTYKYQTSDVGGSVIIHTFGAYFGLACSWVLARSPSHKDISEEDNHSSHTTDTMAMIGTLFLFCFWPSFNAAMAGPVTPWIQQRAVINTLLSICASTFATYAFVVLLYKGKIRMVEVQNATLAGGVIMGASADMYVYPFGAIIAGMCAGIVSCLGFRFLTPLLDRVIGLKDTCGVHNLHGMPGVLGGFVAVIAAANADSTNYTDAQLAEVFFGRAGGRSARTQASYQLAAIATTLAIAITTGAVAGWALRLLPSLRRFYNDDEEFVTSSDAAVGPDGTGEDAPALIPPALSIPVGGADRDQAAAASHGEPAAN